MICYPKTLYLKSACFFRIRGADIGTKDVAAAAKEIEKNLDDMNLDEEPEDDGDDLPVFTPELARLKAKELGQVVESEDQHDEDD